MNLKRIITKHNKGISLVELIVTIAVMSFVTVGISVALVSATRTYNMGNTEVDLQQEVQNISNILNNLVLDADMVSNESVDGEGHLIADTKSLWIKSSNGGYYLLSWNDSSSELSYTKLTFDGEDTYSFDDTKDRYLISKSVESFVATPGSDADGNWDYTVDFDLKFHNEVVGVNAPARTMKTTFLAMSRNGKAVKTEEKKDLAVIVVEKEAIVEPNQTNIEIPFDILLSGDTTGVTYDIVASDDSGVTNSNFATGINYTDAYKSIKFDALKGLKDDFNISINVHKSGVSGSGSGYDEPVSINVYVRRVKNGSNMLASPTITGDYALANSTYTFSPESEFRNNVIQNGERFFALSMDDNYVDPYFSKVTVTKVYSGNVYVYIKNISDDSIVSTLTNPADFLINYLKQYFEVKIDSDLQPGNSVTIRSYTLHSTGERYPDTEDKRNKTDLSYETERDDFYKISAGFFDPNWNWSRGEKDKKVLNTGYHATKACNEYTERLYTGFDNYSDTTNSDYTYVKEIFELMKNKGGAGESATYFTYPLRDNENICVQIFYSIGSKEKPESNHYYEDEEGYYWTQYRPLECTSNRDATNAVIPENTGYRFNINEKYKLELKVVYFSTSNVEVTFDSTHAHTFAAKTILWPNDTDENGYSKLLDLGFGDAGYSFDSWSKFVTGEYESYAHTYNIKDASVKYTSNSEFGIVGDEEVIGSAANPICIGANGEKTIGLDLNSFEGVEKNNYKDYFGGIITVFHSGEKAVGVTCGSPISSTYSVPEDKTYDGGFSCKASQDGFTIYPENIDNIRSKINNETFSPGVYKFSPIMTGVPKAYIVDTDGVFSDTLHYDNNGGSGYTYVLNNGTIYFSIIGRAVTVTLDANGGTVDGANVKDVNYYTSGITSLPSAVLAGKQFDGWYTEASGGSKVTKPTYSTTLYAHWKDLDPYYCTYSVSGSWDGNKNYNVNFTNNTSAHVSSMTVAVPYYGNVSGVDGNVSAVIKDGYIELSFNNSNNGIDAGVTIYSVYVHLSGSGDFGFE